MSTNTYPVVYDVKWNDWFCSVCGECMPNPYQSKRAAEARWVIEHFEHEHKLCGVQ